MVCIEACTGHDTGAGREMRENGRKGGKEVKVVECELNHPDSPPHIRFQSS